MDENKKKTSVQSIFEILEDFFFFFLSNAFQVSDICLLEENISLSQKSNNYCTKLNLIVFQFSFIFSKRVYMWNKYLFGSHLTTLYKH